MRYIQFIAEHRGGSLTKAQHIRRNLSSIDKKLCWHMAVKEE